jgi:AcrR family transcriptional regulator
MRSDAQANRDRLLAAAMEAYAEHGDPSLKSIARRAGVGVGTLYRHFPTKESLVFQLYSCEMRQLVTDLPELIRTAPPFEALREWLGRLARCAASHAGMAEALDGAASAAAAPVLAETYGPVREALADLLRFNTQAGTVEPGVTADDVLLLVSFLWRLGDDAGERARAERLLDMVLRGLEPCRTIAAVGR